MLSSGALGLLHTARPNLEAFQQIVERLAPSVPTRHVLIDDVLADAVSAGTVTEGMHRRTEAAVEGLVRDGAVVVLCTCSTIGGIAEAMRVGNVRVMRVDRPMAEQAVASGRRIVVAASLPSTMGPTLALVRQVATERHASPVIVELLCDGAWPHFERGDIPAYAAEIARAVGTTASRDNDIVVLAQASMAPAADLIAASGIEVLASPELGVRAALEAMANAR